MHAKDCDKHEAHRERGGTYVPTGSALGRVSRNLIICHVQSDMPVDKLDWLSTLDRNRASPQDFLVNQSAIFKHRYTQGSGSLGTHAIEHSPRRRQVKYRPANSGTDVRPSHGIEYHIALGEETSTTDDRSNISSASSRRPPTLDSLPSAKHHAWSSLSELVCMHFASCATISQLLIEREQADLDVRADAQEHGRGHT